MEYAKKTTNFSSLGEQFTIWNSTILGVFSKYNELSKLLVFVKVVLNTITQKTYMETR